MNLFRHDNETELKKLAASISEIGADITPSKRAKNQLKKRLLFAIEEQGAMQEYKGVVTKIKELASELRFPQRNKQSMRSRVLHYISLDLGSFSWMDVCANSIFNRTAWATAMIFIISFVSIFTFQVGTPVSYAKDSVLQNVEGDVYVYRGGMLLSAHNGFVLNENDKIHTGYSASATAIFSDDTVSRVAAESKLNVKKLVQDEMGNSGIILGIKEGRVWSKVSGVTDSDFSVATLQTVVEVGRNATFDVNAASDDMTEISVVENFVDVQLSSYSPAVKTTVVEGESLIVHGDKSEIVSIDERDEWLRMNLSKDEFESKMLAQEESAELEKEVGYLPDNKFYGIKTFKENLGVVLSINEREKLQNQVRIAQKRLNEAEVLASKGLTGSAEEVLREYKQTMLELTREYPDLIGIAEVEGELNKMIRADRMRYNTTLPGSSLYDVKEVIEEVEVLLANDRTRANQIALNQSSDDLYRVFDLLEHGGEAIAEVSIEGYTTTLGITLDNLSAYEQVDRDGYLKAAYATALEDLKTLEALEGVVEDGSNLDVVAIREGVVEKLNESLALYNEDGVYDEFVAELETLQAEDLDELVELSEFVGVNDENAATVDVALDAEEIMVVE